MSDASITERISKTAKEFGRNPGSISLIAVSKRQPKDRVRAVLNMGQRVFGENYVQEAQERWIPLREEYDDIELHMVGPLQSNKARQAVEFFDYIHSLDRPSLAEKIAKAAQSKGTCPSLFVQVNTGEEPQKSGISPMELEAFLPLCEKLDLPVIGLMCIPPAKENAKSHFDTLAQLASDHGLDKLSMGMSADFEDAISAGSTHLRVGSAIFGERQT